MTGGNYRVQRMVTYPDHPDSRVTFDTEVTATSNTEWSTQMAISGTYDGPTDVVAVEGYRVRWTMADDQLIEKGSARLILSSGESVRSEWSSTIVAQWRNAEAFSKAGEIVEVTYSPFRIDGKTMSYDWTGSIRAKEAAQVKP